MKKGKRIVPEVGPKPEDGIVVDASCLPVRDSIPTDGYFHGVVEWQAVDLVSGQTIHASRPYEYGNINLAEFIAIVDALSLLHANGNTSTPVYSDSLTAIAWVKNRKMKTRHPRTGNAYRIMGLADASMDWLLDTKPMNPVRFWDNVLWGENPADYGRK